MTVATKFSPPGENPTPDNQGKSNTCTRYGLSKAVTGGLHDGTFGTKIDVSQDYVTSGLVNKVNDVGGRWPTDFNQETILALDRITMVFYLITMSVVECSFAALQQNWDNSKFVVVYKKTLELHCIYVNKVENGKLCCINSHGNKEQFPQLNPGNVYAIYKVNATSKRAPNSSQLSPKTKRASMSSSQTSLTKQSYTDTESVMMKQMRDELKKKDEELKKKDEEHHEELKKREKEHQDELKKKEQDHLDELKKKKEENMLSEMTTMNSVNNDNDKLVTFEKEKRGFWDGKVHWIKKRYKEVSNKL